MPRRLSSWVIFKKPYMSHIIWFIIHDSITFSKAGACQHTGNWQAPPVDLCNFDSCIYLDKMFAKAYELKNIVTSNIDLDTCVEIPPWRYWHLVVPFLLGLGNFEIIVFYGIMSHDSCDFFLPNKSHFLFLEWPLFYFQWFDVAEIEGEFTT